MLESERQAQEKRRISRRALTKGLLNEQHRSQENTMRED